MRGLSIIAWTGIAILLGGSADARGYLSAGINERVQTVDMLELNRYETCGVLRLQQVIVWEWSPDYRRYNVICWLGVTHKTVGPIRVGNWWEIEAADNQERKMRFRSKIYRETVTSSDPERDNIRLHPLEMRLKQ